MANSRKKIIVIGAGMGGLSAATQLAVAGFDVTLLERQPHTGGKMREVVVDGRGIDSGPTVFTMRWVFEQLFADAGEELSEHLALERPEVLARHAWLDGSRLDLYSDVELSVEAVAEFAGPREAQAYARFARDSEDVFKTLDHTFMRCEKPGPLALTFSLGLSGIPKLYATRPYRTLWRELGRYFSDPRLRQLFGRYATYCGSSPLQAPATLMLIAHAERAGVWSVTGGMQRLAEALTAMLERQGVALRTRSEVSRIDTHNGHVRAVELASGETLAADAVVFNGDVQALQRGLLGNAVRSALPSRSGEPRSLSAVTWSLSGSAEGFPLAYHTVFFGGEYANEFTCLFGQGKTPVEPTVYVCAQDHVDSRPDPEAGDQRLFLLVNAPARPMPDQELDELESRTWGLLDRHGLRITPGSPPVRTSPFDFDQRFPGSDGAIYGWPTHGMTGSFRRWGSRSRIPGLYLAGGTVHPGPGVPMAALSGRIAAASVAADLGQS
ncbi:MAG: phytoene desaturase family protein [Xanthomonadales bacterium]|nr:phytoene desaturase family protein [Xanthomonadales bacterium]